MGHAHRALAGAGAAQRGALDEFDVLEATIPHTLQVFDVDLRAGAHGAAGRAGRQFVCSGSGTDDTYCRFVGHPGEQVAWRPQRRGDNRGTTRLAGAIGGDDGSDPTIGAVETHEIGEVDFDRIRQLDPGGAQLGSSALGENAAQHVAVADRVQIGRAGGDDHLVTVHVHEAVAGCTVETYDHQRAGVDTDDVVAGCAIEHHDVAADSLRRGCFGSTAATGADDHQVCVYPHDVDRTVHWCLRGVGGGSELQRRCADGRMTAHGEAGAGRREAGARPGGTVDVGRAVAAVAGEAERAAMLRVLACPNDCNRHRIAFGELDRLVVESEAHERILIHGTNVQLTGGGNCAGTN